VEKLAAEYLELAAVYRCNWNYGNAVHDANRYLGLMRLKNGNTAGAVEHLLRAGKSTGSPQLDTFGPELDLANELLKQGSAEPVMEYLRDIKRFWRLDQGQVVAWLSSIEKGERPELSRFAANQPSAAQVALFWFVLTWPLLVIGGTLYLLRRRIVRKWLFGITGVVAGYVAMFVSNITLAFAIPRVLASMSDAGSVTMTTLTYISVGIGLLIPLLAIVAISRFFVSAKNAS